MKPIPRLIQKLIESTQKQKRLPRFPPVPMLFLVFLFATVLVQADQIRTQTAARNSEGETLPNSADRQPLVIMINTSEQASNFSETTPYLDEYYDMKIWEKIYPGVKIVRIRSSTNEGVRKGLELWLRPDARDPYEVVGLFINSHGNRMFLANMPKSFRMRLPGDLESVFGPLKGRLGPRARVVFAGCSILKNMKPDQAHESLKSIANFFQAESLSIYANHSLGLMNHEMIKRNDIYNQDIGIKHRALYFVATAFWFVSLPATYILDRTQNQGFLLDQDGSHTELYKTNYFQALHPNPQAAKQERASW